MSKKEENKEKEEFQRFSISLPKNLYDTFEIFRKKNNFSRSDAIRKAMNDYMLKETKTEKILSSEFIMGLIVLNLEHKYAGDAHDHSHLSAEEHAKAHSYESNHTHSNDEKKPHSHNNDEYSIEEILNSNYFTYQDTDLIKINHLEHFYHDIVLSKLHVHAEHDTCLIIIPVKGLGERIQEFYKTLISLKSVKSHEIIIEE